MKRNFLHVFSIVLIIGLILGFAPPQTLVRAELAGDLFFSEYIEGSSNNKAIEIYNSTGVQ